MRCCAPSPGIARRFWRARIRWTTIRPAWLAQRWRSTYGESVARAIALAHRSEPTLDLSVKSDPAGLGGEAGRNCACRPARCGSTAMFPLRSSKATRTGGWWVQDAAAALPAKLLRPAPRHADRRSLRRAGRKSGGIRRGGRGTSLQSIARRSGSNCSPPISPACAFTPRSWSPTRFSSTRRRSMRCSWTRRAARPAQSAAIPTSRGSSGWATLPRSSSCKPTCSIRRSSWRGRAARSSIASARSSPRRAKPRSPHCCAAIPTCGALAVAPEEIGGLAECVTPAGDLRTLPCHLWGDDPRRSGLDGFFAARLLRAEQDSAGSGEAQPINAGRKTAPFHARAANRRWPARRMSIDCHCSIGDLWASATGSVSPVPGQRCPKTIESPCSARAALDERARTMATPTNEIALNIDIPSIRRSFR